MENLRGGSHILFLECHFKTEEIVKKLAMVLFVCFFICGMISIANAQVKIGFINSDRVLAEFEEAPLVA